MPFAMNNGVRIHYEVEGAGPPLVLQHGFTDSMVSWYDRGYVEVLKQHNLLVLIDARGHNASDKPHNPEAYAAELNVGDVIAVLDRLGISKTRYFGYSMGGLIGFGMAQFAPTRVRAMILGGASPDPAPPGAMDPLMSILKQGAPALLTSAYAGFLTPALEARLLSNDMDALIANRQKRFASQGFSEILGSLEMECLLFAGDADPIYEAVKASAAKMANATFFALTGLQHYEAFVRSDLVLPHVMRFLTKVHTSDGKPPLA